MATNMLLGNQGGKPHGKQSGLGGIGGLAASVLGGGQGSHSGSHGGGGGGGGNIVGKLAGGLLGGKPQGSSGHSGQSGSGHQQGGLAGMAASFLGGQHGSVKCPNCLMIVA